jgi:hypothetical protein
MPIVPAFPAWLRQQVSREVDDPVGVLARVVAGLEHQRGQPFNDLVPLYCHVRQYGGPLASRCFDLALAEWRSLALPIRRTRSRLPNPLNDARDALSQT